MPQHGGALRTRRHVKGAGRRRTSAVWFPLCEAPRAVRALDTEDRAVVSGRRGGAGSEGLKLPAANSCGSAQRLAPEVRLGFRWP